MVHESESPVSLPDPFHGEVLFVNEAEELNNGHFPELRSAQRHSSARALGWAQRRCLCLILPTSREGFLVLVRPTALEGVTRGSEGGSGGDSPNDSGGVRFFSTDLPNGSGGAIIFSTDSPSGSGGAIFLSTDSPNGSGGGRCFFKY